MSDPSVDGWDVAKALWAVIVSIFSGITLWLLRTVRQNEKSIVILQNTQISRTEFVDFQKEHRDLVDELRSSVISTMVGAVDRIESAQRAGMTQVHETQNMILKELLARKKP